MHRLKSLTIAPPLSPPWPSWRRREVYRWKLEFNPLAIQAGGGRNHYDLDIGVDADAGGVGEVVLMWWWWWRWQLRWWWWWWRRWCWYWPERCQRRWSMAHLSKGARWMNQRGKEELKMFNKNFCFCHHPCSSSSVLSATYLLPCQFWFHGLWRRNQGSTKRLHVSKSLQCTRKLVFHW